ncbi:MAG TPA: MarC family protein [Candidatus Scatocola faecipullorum]|mgnify:FL=1|uniref:UPF0056 membrane protein n=1 Tax=Candidatus Scatocola faecipullorum TaxID=2840917 RepID=A0A9D1M3Y3_9PROT|nr:MarC family protein [Candidatus Scatocola faecipullorum]
MLGEFNIQQFVSAFVVLFAVIDVTGSIPIFLSLKKKGKKIDAKKAALLSLGMFIGFFYVGEAFLNLFHVDISSFAIAGSLIIFVMALEMILDIEIFKNSPDSPKEATFIPVVFPLIAGAGGLTTLLSIRSQYSDINIILAVLLNVLWIYIVLKITKKIDRILGTGTIYMLQKFFGIILLAISVKLFTHNLAILLKEMN